jgi:hypothetical protein
MLMRKFIGLGIVLLFPLACGDDGNEVQDEIEGTADCTQICSRYADCISDIDETECVDECEDIADATEAGETSAENCEDCLDGKTCTEAESCWANCPVVPIPD